MNKKSPIEFRNALYQHLVDHNVTEDTAIRIAGEAELYVEAYKAYRLRGIEAAATSMGFELVKGEGQRMSKVVCFLIGHTWIESSGYENKYCDRCGDSSR